jgi:hypothetical protein
MNLEKGLTEGMSTLAKIEQEAAGLPMPDKESLLSWLQAEISAEKNSHGLEQRMPGLGKGAWCVADDFDAPLPDEFWLGDDA